MSRHPRQPGDTDKEEGFLTRWSRRKARTEPSESEPTEPLPSDTDSQTTQEPIKRDEDMPPLETIDEDSDVSEFFSPGVSETLRKAALRKLFHSPAFNIVDGLDDYDDDFTTFKALGDIITADMRHQMELEEERERARKMENPEDGSTPIEDTDRDTSVEEADTRSVDDSESENAAEPRNDAEDDLAQSDSELTDEYGEKGNEGKHTA